MTRPNSLLLGLTVLLLASPQNTAAQPNLLTNPGFENGATGWQSDENQPFVWQGALRHSGQSAAAVTAYYDCCNPWFYFHSVSQVVPVTAGGAYTAQVWTQGDAANGFARMTFLNAQGNSLPGEAYAALGAPTGAWVYHTWDATAPMNAVSCRVTVQAEHVQVNIEGRLWIDDAVLMATPVGVESSGTSNLLSIVSYPNPARSEVTFGIALARPAAVRVRIVDLRGRIVAVLDEGATSRGQYQLHWNRLTSQGVEAPAGLYLYELRAGAERRNGRLLLLD